MFIGIHTNQQRHRPHFAAALDILIRANTVDGFIGLTTAGNAERSIRVVDQNTPTLEIVMMVPGLNVLKDVDLSKHALINEMHRNGPWPVTITAITNDVLEAEVLMDLGKLLPVAWTAVALPLRTEYIPQDVRILSIEVQTEVGSVSVPAVSFTYAVPERKTAIVSIYNEVHPQRITIKCPTKEEHE